MIGVRDTRDWVRRHPFLVMVLAATMSALSSRLDSLHFHLGDHPAAHQSAGVDQVANAAQPARPGPADSAVARRSSGSAVRPVVASRPEPVATVAAPAQLPDLVGVTLDRATTTAAAAGFHRVASADALAAGRVQLVDGNWKVCSQRPSPGRYPPTTRITVRVVKLAETCPASAPVAEAARMPDLVGQPLSTAEDILSDAVIHEEDGSGAGRMVIVTSHWKVCSTSPAPGAEHPPDGPVTLTVVKNGELCP